MLSVNKILIFLLTMILTSSLYASEVSEFDIKGIKLGMSEKKVLKTIPCSKPKVDLYIGGGKIISCQEPSLYVLLDHTLHVYEVEYSFHFKTEPDFKKLEARFLKKYGNTELVNKYAYSGDPYTKRISYCWGTCSDGGQKFGLPNSEEKGLTIEYARDTKYRRYWMHLMLGDSKKKYAHMKHEKKAENAKKKKEQEKATNVDF